MRRWGGPALYFYSCSLFQGLAVSVWLSVRIWLMWLKTIKKETWLPRAKGNTFLLRSPVWMASVFSISFPVLIRMSLEFVPLFQGHRAELDSTCSSWDIPINLWLFAWFSLLSFIQNQMLDYSKRSRSGKFRLVTKFKKEKNNKNKETHSSMGLPGTKSAHSLCLSVIAVWSHHYLSSLHFILCSLFLLFHVQLPVLGGLVCHFPVAKKLIAPVCLSHGPLVPCKYSWAETGGTLWKVLPMSRHFQGYFRGA